jgi:glycosyltransferase involved in cell wall biosynthesis
MPRIERAVVVTATAPEPRRNGKTVVLGGILDHLCARLGPGNVHVVQIGPATDAGPVTAYRHHLLVRPGPARQLASFARNVALRNRLARRRLSFQEAALRSNRLEHDLWALLHEIDAGLEVWDTVRTGQFVATSVRVPEPSGRARRILYADDLFSERYSTMIETPLAEGDPGGEYARLLPAPARPLLRNGAIGRLLLRAERKLVAEAERTQPPWFDGTYLAGPAEADRLRRRCPDARIGTLSPLLPVPPYRRRTFTGKPVFVVLGDLRYAPNRDGLDWFLRECRPAVLARIPSVEIRVIGRGEPLAAAAAWGEHVRFEGFVDDLGEALRGCAALLSPLRTGSGVKIKVIEALAHGTPVVGTAAGLRGIPPNRACLLGDSAPELAARMRDILQVNLSEHARAAWSEHWSPEVVRPRYDLALGLARGGPDAHRHPVRHEAPAVRVDADPDRPERPRALRPEGEAPDLVGRDRPE